jgi:hypothetical protein
VLYNGVETESRFSWFGQGYYHLFTSRADYPAGGNWVGNFKFRLDDTSLLLGTLQDGFALPESVAIVRSWSLDSVNNGQYNSTTKTIPYYYRLVFSIAHITGFNEAYIWRRKNAGIIAGNAPYYGVGRWERLTLNTSFSGYNATTKEFTVNLKMPISYQEFNRSTSANTTTNLFVSSPAQPTKNVNIPNTSAFRAVAPEEFYIQLRANSVTEPQAIKLLGTQPLTGVSSVNIISLRGAPTRVVFATEADDDQYDIGWLRKTTEARTTSTNTAIIARPNIVYVGWNSEGEDFITGAL